MSLLLLFFLGFFTRIRCDFSGYVPYDYCDPNLKLCPVPRSHTMCQYPVPGLSQDCAPYVNQPLTPPEKVQILALHNKLRSRIASGEEKTPLGTLPSASNMLQMRWDDELEVVADRWVSRCFNVTVTKIHDDCRNTKRFRVTQNIGTIGSKGITAEKQVTQVFFYHWYIKSKSFNPRIIDAYAADENRTSEEFVNLIWADTYALGCASVMFRNNVTDSQEDDRPILWTFERIVCNYGPGGIVPGKPVYKIGAPCSQCPIGWVCSKQYNGLCELNEDLISSTSKTTKRNYAINLRETSHITFNVGSSTFRYAKTSRKTSKSQVTGIGFQEWSFSPADNETGKYNFKLKMGIYYNGMCHCPDITRYGFEGSKKHPTNITEKLEKLRSLITRSIRNVIPQLDAGKIVFGLKNGDRCYCKTNISNAGDRCKQSTFVLLFMVFIMKLLIYCLQ